MTAVSRAGASAPASSGGAFDPRIILAVIVAGALSIAAYTFLSAYSPQLSSGNNGGAHALSNSATGFSALVALAKESGMASSVHRDEDDSGEGALLVLTPELGTEADAVKKQIEAHQANGPTLIILPKWLVQKHPVRPGWVQRLGDTPFMFSNEIPEEYWGVKMSAKRVAGAAKTAQPVASSFDDGSAPVHLILPPDYIAIDCAACEDGLRLADGKYLVATSWPDYPVFILAEPDLLNNYGLRDKARGKAAMELLSRIASYGDADRLAFDVTLNGFGKKKSILRFLFEPPFLAVTLCLVLAAILAGWQAFNRFGPPARRAREIALGKNALIANGAELMKQAGKDHHGAGVYARHVRDQLASALKAPSGLEDEALNRWLDRFTPTNMKSFSQLMHEMTGAPDAGEMVKIGREMSRWRKGVLREH
ncbi:hypothetical protein DMP17_09715 [Pseudonocardia sp. TMWB2A]|uniref:hypothetical protein n=1 Tax=Pseudonocardia sp. TMWB2A TaxID=687430 RepID=UPI00307F8971